MIRQLCIAAIAVAAIETCDSCVAQAAPIAIVNPGGEAYPTGPNTSINPGGVAPIESTGWNSTLPVTVGISGAEGINNNAFSGVMRMSVGATDGGTVAAEDFALFQETGHVAAEGDVFKLDFVGRAFFQFQAGTDVQTSLFGYVDGNGSLVRVDQMAHATTVGGVWTPATSHVYTVPSGSPLIGENLAIGFFTDTPGVGTGGFTAVDDVSLSLVPEPYSLAICLAALCGCFGGRQVRRVRSTNAGSTNRWKATE
jgi:hypothetical protein